MRKFLLTTYYLLLTRRRGQSLVEVLIALAVGAIFIIGATTIIMPSLRSNSYAQQLQASAALGKELLENVRVFSEANWHNIYDLNKTSSTTYYLTTSTSPFAAAAGTETLTVSTSTYTRYFYIDNVSRDASGYITASGGTNDPSTQKVTVISRWSGGATSTLTAYLARFRDLVLDQTDWSGGPGQDGPATSTNNQFSTSSKIDYTTTTGSILIKFQ